MYRSILVHMTNERRAGALLDRAIALGEKFGSHVIGLYIFPAFLLTPPVPMPFGRELAGTLRGKLCEEERRIRHIFDAATRDLTITSEWRSLTAERPPVAEKVLEYARAADLVVVSQADPDWGFSDVLDCPDRLAIESGRPVIVLPSADRFCAMPRTILIAWNSRRESARAVFDALPFLTRAENVEVLSIDEQSSDETRRPGAEIAESLARHGANVKVTNRIPDNGSAAELIRARALDLSADLIVMGAYGHPRLNEFVIGDVTRHLLAEMTVPVLFSC